MGEKCGRRRERRAEWSSHIGRRCRQRALKNKRTAKYAKMADTDEGARAIQRAKEKRERESVCVYYRFGPIVPCQGASPIANEQTL